MTLTTKLRLEFDTLYTATGLGADAEYRPDTVVTYNWASGTGANQADRMRLEEIAFTTGVATVDIRDATSTVLGTEGVIAEAVGIIMINKQGDGTANTHAVTFGPAGVTNAYVGAFASAANFIPTIDPGGFVAIIDPGADGLGATATGAKNLAVQGLTTGASGAVTLITIGRSA